VKRSVALAVLSCLIPAAGWAQDAGVELFEKSIRPLFAEKCQVCHGAAQQMGGLNLATAEGFRKGSQHGPLIAQGASENSRLLSAVSYEQPLKMPPSGKLADAELAALEKWVKLGAPWPEADAKAARSQDGSAFWSFQPVKAHEPPQVKRSEWVRNEVDRFILTKIEAAGLAPAPPADKLTWLRRATYDLTGLPPTSAEIDAFLADDSATAYETVVDRLLASPRYGERWGRHWLDVARYADSTGADEDHRYPYAWRYRDYVIKAFNDDKPVRPFRAGADRRRPDAARRPARPRQRRRHRRHGLSGPRRQAHRRDRQAQAVLRRRGRADRRHLEGIPWRHARLRALPRPQVRSLPDDRLLRHGVDLR
jgi:hypothetical protein